MKKHLAVTPSAFIFGPVDHTYLDLTPAVLKGKRKDLTPACDPGLDPGELAGYLDYIFKGVLFAASHNFLMDCSGRITLYLNFVSA